MPCLVAIVPSIDWHVALPLATGLVFAATAVVIGRRLARRIPGPAPLPTDRPLLNDPPSWVPPGSAPRPPVTERRKTPRREGRTVKVEMRKSDGKEVVGEAVIIDRSNGGLRLLSMTCLPLGAQLNVRPLNAGSDLPWVLIEVRNCRHRRLRGWEMGCLFLRPPPWHVGMHLG